MICNEVLKEQHKSYPRTCAVHGLNKCPERNFIARYKAAKGQVQREWIVTEIVQSPDGIENEIHRLLQQAATKCQKTQELKT